ncbi:caspase domain-containing protein [Desarmillaria tabescens]|uniref:Caspase domain-containing protein n=1 Tax=Armillaria tabescens TaxID=1929756 RepID=A0AA39NPG7_ARMTA|nr:caspase domain-containing protein [Desarmillaria tabescens]KAK0469386.1 caspase domain-containing protein [Desarmillaria tabescens]
MAGQCDQDVYVQLMSTLGHGYPLWLPNHDPNLPPTYPKDGTRVGDLGYLTDEGGFAYLFNVCTDVNNPSNFGRVPPDFVPLKDIPEPAVEKRLELHGKNTVLTASSGRQSPIRLDQPPVRVKFEAGRGYEFTCSAAQAAILVLPDGGERYDSILPHLLEKYAAANAHSWYKYFNSPAQHRQIRNGMLYLVTGFDKCRSWGNACYSRPSDSPSISPKFSTTGTTGLDGSMRYSWDVQNLKGIHTQSYFPGTVGMPASQTVFLRGYSISVRPDPSFQGLAVGPVSTSRRIAKGSQRRQQSLAVGSRGNVAKPNTYSNLDIPYSHTNLYTNTSVQSFSKQYKAINPSNLQVSLPSQFSGAQIALTHDGHWMSMVKDGQNPLDARFASYAIEDNLLSVSKLEVPTENAWVAKGTTLSREPPTPETRGIFALVIGIDEYEYEGYENLLAAVADADRFENYLLEGLRTPEEHIVSLRNGQATRKAIIDGFKSLTHNPRIVPGMTAIIIYYSGHGAVTPKPDEWTDWQTYDNEIEMLCPTDIGVPYADDKVVEGIPDRTISELLLELATAKGNNITLILDCCHAAGINRGMQPADVQNAKSRRILNPPKLSADCDSTMVSRGSSGVKITSGFSGSLWDSHVLLAACNRRQSAWEVDGQGIFTRALLKIMGKNPVNELTYRSLIHRLVMPGFQTPHLEGRHTLRRLFDSWEEPADSSMILCRHEQGEPHFVLHAGLLHGITIGSTFEIFRTDLSDLKHPFIAATVSKVETFISFLIPLDPGFLTSNKNRRVWYARLQKASGANFGTYCNDSNILTRILTEDYEPRITAPVIAAETSDDADLCLTVKDEVVYFDRGSNIRLFSPNIGFASRFPRVSQVNDIAHIRSVINGFARFIAQLTIPSPLPIEQFVSIEMNKLQRVGRSLTPVGDNLLSAIKEEEKPIEFVVDTSLPWNRSPSYGFTIRNVSDVDLYVYLFYFDATSFEIDAWYSSKMSPNNKEEQGSVDSCLQKGSTLTLGYGNGGMNPFTFTVPDGQDVDVCFFKLFVTAKPVDLGSISQSSPFSDLRTRSSGSPAPSPPDLTESWASIAIPVVQRRAQPVVSNTPPKLSIAESSPIPSRQGVASLPPPNLAPAPDPAPMESSKEHAQLSQWLTKSLQTLKEASSYEKLTAVARAVITKLYEKVRSWLWF